MSFPHFYSARAEVKAAVPGEAVAKFDGRKLVTKP